MIESILNSIKKNLGVPEDYDVFDADLILYINAALSTLHQVGLGPLEGFAIKDATTKWVDLLGDDLRLNNVQAYITLKVRLIFDPPPTSFGIAAVEKLAEEALFRVMIVADPAPIPDKLVSTVEDVWAD